MTYKKLSGRLVVPAGKLLPALRNQYCIRRFVDYYNYSRGQALLDKSEKTKQRKLDMRRQ